MIDDRPFPWLKFYTSLLDEPRLSRQPDRVCWRYIELYLLAGKADAGGMLQTAGGALNLEDLAWTLRIDPEDLAKDLAALENTGLVQHDGSGWFITRFEEEQGPSHAKKREQWRERQSKHRKGASGSEKEQEREESKNKNKSKNKKVSVTHESVTGESLVTFVLFTRSRRFFCLSRHCLRCSSCVGPCLSANLATIYTPFSRVISPALSSSCISFSSILTSQRSLQDMSS